MSKGISLSRPSDLPMLHFLWLWKIATTAALHLRFFPGSHGNTVYNRLLRLKQFGYLEQRHDETGTRKVWALGKKGFQVIRPLLPALREEGYRSANIQHDLLVNAVHLGDWLIDFPANVEVFTEQQLRRYHPDFFPDWLGKPNLVQGEPHRPDGYWRIWNHPGAKTVALEVELSQKCDSDYRALGDWYATQGRANRVIWITPSDGMGKSIHRLLNASHLPEADIHNVIRLSDFFNYGWLSTVQYGPNRGSTIASLIGYDCMGRPQATAGPTSGHGPRMALLDTHLKHVKSVA